MEKDRLFHVSQAACNHTKERHYTQRNFDMLNGFEFVFYQVHELPQNSNYRCEKIRQSIAYFLLFTSMYCFPCLSKSKIR